MLGVPNACISRRTNGAESPIAVVEGEDRPKATLSGPCRTAIRRRAEAVSSSAWSQPISTQPGIGIAFRPGTPQRVGQPVRMIDEFRRGAALGAKRLPGGVRGIGVQPDEAAIFDHRHRPHRAMQRLQWPWIFRVLILLPPIGASGINRDYPLVASHTGG